MECADTGDGVKQESEEEPEYIYVDESVCRVKLEVTDQSLILPKDKIEGVEVRRNGRRRGRPPKRASQTHQLDTNLDLDNNTQGRSQPQSQSMAKKCKSPRRQRSRKFPDSEDGGDPDNNDGTQECEADITTAHDTRARGTEWMTWYADDCGQELDLALEPYKNKNAVRWSKGNVCHQGGPAHQPISSPAHSHTMQHMKELGSDKGSYPDVCLTKEQFSKEACSPVAVVKEEGKNIHCVNDPSIIDDERHNLNTIQKIYECPDCDKGFSQYGSLKRHRLTHTGEKPFECADCQKKFSERVSLQKHILTHTGEKPFECADCHKRFTQYGHMKRHKLTHTGEKSFECPDCHKWFSLSSSMKRHRLTHTGEKPFECPDCHKRFSQSSNMEKHRLTHTGEKPFECPECYKRFSQYAYLKQHRVIHISFECPD